MSFVFLSHAAVDKNRHVRPIAHALALEGVALWLDRPGLGDNHFNFDGAFVDRYGIRGLRPGRPWDEQISQALRDCGAVLGCLSSALLADRAVLNQELAIAWHLGKLVTCRIDDIDPSILPAQLGLPNLGRIQSVSIDTARLSKAVLWLQSRGNSSPSDLPVSLASAWVPVSDLRQALLDIAPVLAAGSDEQVIARLLTVPVGPAVMAHEIPLSVIQAMSDRHADAASARSHFDRAMQRAEKANSEGFTAAQIVLRPGEVPSPYGIEMDTYWAAVLPAAGIKSRRTLAALLEPDLSIASTATKNDTIEIFLRWLGAPTKTNDS